MCSTVYVLVLHETLIRGQTQDFPSSTKTHTRGKQEISFRRKLNDVMKSKLGKLELVI